MDLARGLRIASRFAYLLAALAAVRMVALGGKVSRPAGDARPIEPGAEVEGAFRAWSGIRYWLELELRGRPSRERRRNDPPPTHMTVTWSLTESGVALAAGTDTVASDGSGNYVRLAAFTTRIGRRYTFRARAEGDTIGGRTAVAVSPAPKADMDFQVAALVQIVGFTLLGWFLGRRGRAGSQR